MNGDLECYSLCFCSCTHLQQWRYREQYERAKDKFTSILETPEYEAHRRSKKIGDVSFAQTNLKDNWWKTCIDVVAAALFRSSTGWSTTRPRPRATPCLMTLHTSCTWRRSRRSPATWVLVWSVGVRQYAVGCCFWLCAFLCLTAEVQRGLREEQSSDQHGPRGSFDPCRQGGL